jgi:type IV secretory pathway TraG/TraD family ATPase VirD4
VLQMPSGEEIILRPGMKPVRARKIQWWREPAFTKCRLPPPTIPQLRVDIALDDGSMEIVRKNQRAMSGLSLMDIGDVAND